MHSYKAQQSEIRHKSYFFLRILTFKNSGITIVVFIFYDKTRCFEQEQERQPIPLCKYIHTYYGIHSGSTVYFSLSQFHITTLPFYLDSIVLETFSIIFLVSVYLLILSFIFFIQTFFLSHTPSNLS